MRVSIVIATYNKLEYTQGCIASIRQHTAPGSYEIIVVDNASTDDTRDWLREQQDIRCILNEDNMGFPHACNQGIGIAEGDGILLLNNDTVVTERWLTNMLSCLLSADDIGAVGTVTNNCSYFQSIPVPYAGVEEMHAFASGYNVSDPQRWEERLKLIGYNMLIRRAALDRVGQLDERFTPGNYEDDDLSYRLRRAGYRLMLCKDTFIHHYGSVSFGAELERFHRLLRTNAAKFEAKWDFDPADDMHIRQDVVDLIRRPADAPLRVLEAGAGAGGTLLQVRNRYPQARLFGIEERAGAAESVGLFATALHGDTEQAYATLPAGSFDVIFLNRRLQRFADREAALRRTRELLKPGGVLLLVAPNLAQPATLYALLDGTIGREALSAPTYGELCGLLERTGFAETEITGIYNGISDLDRQLLHIVNSLRGLPDPVNFNFSEFVVRAVKPETDGMERELQGAEGVGKGLRDAEGA